MSYAFNSPCQRAPLPSYKGLMNFWVLKVALQRLPCPPDVTGPKTWRHMKACVRMIGAGWHRAWSLLIWSWPWFDRLYFHVKNLQRLQRKSFSKPVKPLLTLKTLKFCSFCWKYIHVLTSCTGLMKKRWEARLSLGTMWNKYKKRSKVVVLINDLFFFPWCPSLCPLACKKWRDEPGLWTEVAVVAAERPLMALRKQTNCLPYRCPIDSDLASENCLHPYLHAHHLKENFTLTHIKCVYTEMLVMCLMILVQIWFWWRSSKRFLPCHISTGDYY